MTVTIDQAIIGALHFADNEIIPHLPDGKGIAVGVMLVLSVDEGRERLYMSSLSFLQAHSARVPSISLKWLLHFQNSYISFL